MLYRFVGGPAHNRHLEVDDNQHVVVLPAVEPEAIDLGGAAPSFQHVAYRRRKAIGPAALIAWTPVKSPFGVELLPSTIDLAGRRSVFFEYVLDSLSDDELDDLNRRAA